MIHIVNGHIIGESSVLFKKLILMSTTDALNFIAGKFALDNEQVERLRELPNAWWRKCAKAIAVSKGRGYDLDIDINAFISGKPKPGVFFCHSYEIFMNTKTYKHIIGLRITV